MNNTICTCLSCGIKFTKKPYGKNMYCSHPCRGKGSVRSLEESFLAKVVKAEGDQCWSWTGAKISAGYGHFSASNRQHYLAHRYSYILHCGPIPEGMHVLHRCDNPICTNPAHLFLGTNLDNIKDRVAKGRSRSNPPTGAKHHNAKMTEDDVRRLRKLREAGGISFEKLGKQFGISACTAHHIATRRGWKHVA